MSKEKFNIKPGIYTIPNFGRIDCTKAVKQEVALELYLNKHFSQFISLTEAGVDFLKKQKLNSNVVAGLITRAKTEEQINLLLQVNDSKTVKRIAENRIQALK